jgi:tetratricopeptide (TPR) repeat protein
MDDTLPPLSLLAALFRARRSGVLALGSRESGIRLLLRDGQIAGLGPVGRPAAPSPAALPRPDDSAAMRLERVLQEIGIRKAASRPSAHPAPASASWFRDRVLGALSDPDLRATFEDGAPTPPDVAEVAGATEPLILEAVRRLRDEQAVQRLLGDLDRRLVATAALADERTLTLTEGYILSRIDGVSTARQVLKLVPLDPDETQRTMLGLLLTGRVESRSAEPAAVPSPAVESPEEPAPPSEGIDGGAGSPPNEVQGPEEPGDADERAFPTVEAAPDAQEAPAAAPPPAALDPQALARRREILESFQSLPLKNHFEVLGVEPGCTDADVRRAYVALTKRFHPDAHRDDRLADLHNMLEEVYIRVQQAWEVLGDARRRASYEARPGVVRRSDGGARPASAPPPKPEPDDFDYVSPEETLLKAQLLMVQARYWDAIQVLETAIPRLEPRRHQLRGRVLLARAYAKNPNWLRKAEEQLQEVVREDPVNVDAHYELGLLFKAGGRPARAQAMFRRVLELRPDHREAVAELGPSEGTGPGAIFKRIFGRGKAS